MDVIGHGPQAREWEWSWEDTLKEWRLGRIYTHGGLKKRQKDRPMQVRGQCTMGRGGVLLAIHYQKSTT